MIQAQPKDPQADLDYLIDWTDWLQGDVITSSTWITGVLSGIVAYNWAILDGSKTLVWLKGGKLGEQAITNHVVTAAGRRDNRTLVLQIIKK